MRHRRRLPHLLRLLLPHRLRRLPKSSLPEWVIWSSISTIWRPLLMGSSLDWLDLVTMRF